MGLGVVILPGDASPPLFLEVIWYGSFVVFNSMIIWVLARFIWQARRVSTDVLFAGMTIYLTIAWVFGPLYMVFETLQPGSFITSTGAAITWQRMVYFSFATLTTLGFGDIAPAGAQVQALAGFEAAAGTLYIAILIGRLVGLHTQHED